MNFEDFKDKIKGTWVRVSDVEINFPLSNYSYVEADVRIPYGTITMDIEKYTKYVQDKAIKTFTDAFILNHMSITTGRKIFPEIYKDGETYDMAHILKHYSGSEIISRLEKYEKRKRAEETKKETGRDRKSQGPSRG